MPFRPVTDSTFGADVQATFIPADPPRESWLALWSQSPSSAREIAKLPLENETIDLVVPEADKPRQLQVTVKKLPIRSAIDVLMLTQHKASEQDNHRATKADKETASSSEDPSPTASALAWARTTAFTLGLIAKGRLQPSLTPTGIDMWKLGPLDQADAHWQTAMAQALPPAARATPGPQDADNDNLTLTAAAPLVLAFSDAVTDTFVRTAAAPIASGHQAFSSERATVVDPQSQTPLLTEMFESPGIPLLTLRIDWPPFERRKDDHSFVGTLTFQERLNPSRFVSAAALWAAPEPLRKKLHLAESTLVRNLRSAVRAEPLLRPLLDQPQPVETYLSENDVTELLNPETKQRLAMAGLLPTLPDNLFRSVELRPVLGSAAAKSSTSASGPSAANRPRSGQASTTSTSSISAEPSGQLTSNRIDLNELVELRWLGSLDGDELTEAELAELIDSKRTLIRLRGEWIRLDDDDRTRLTERKSVANSTALAASLGAPVIVDGEVLDIEVAGPLSDLGERLANRDSAVSCAAPPNLKADLRPYQQRGLAWLTEMDQLGLGGILADDMGLGKTVQVLALHLLRQQLEPGPTLVVCPASVVGNWEREANRFSPDTTVHRYHSSSRSLKSVNDGDLVVTTYGIIRQDAEQLAKVPWGLVVADEAQAIKNPYSRSAQAIRNIPSQTRFALTGTPVQNQLSDLWALLDWTTPGLLGTLPRFRREIAAPIEKGGDAEAAQTLNRQLRPFLLRRQKSDPEIAPELPPKTQTDEIVPLTREQAALYQAVVSEVMAEIRSSHGIERKGLVLRLLTQLKQICNHPAQFLKETTDLTGRSGKLRATTELLRVIKEEGHASLVFTQYVKMGELLVQHLQAEGFTTSFLNGSLSLSERDRMVSEFQAGDTEVFIVSLRAGGVGLNLTQASHVIHYDRWWNPAVEDQASDRAWRIGQTKPVQVHRLISEGTVEDRIAALLQSKRQLAESVVGSGESWLSELNDEDLADLVSLAGEGVESW